MKNYSWGKCGNHWIFRRRKKIMEWRSRGDIRSIAASESQRGMKNQMGTGFRGVEIMDNETLSEANPGLVRSRNWSS